VIYGDVEPEVLQRANNLLTKLNTLSEQLDGLPENAPIRIRLEGEYEEKSAEYRRLIADIQEAQGQEVLF
jgi:uncharacterized protein involved in exopolysaccharide biosynthesis